MAEGAIIENMSSRKLLAVGAVVLLLQTMAFLVGGLISPNPTAAMRYLATKCVRERDSGPNSWLEPWGPAACVKLRDLDEATERRIEANRIVFSIHMPHPGLEMNAWFQYLLVVLEFDIQYWKHNPIVDKAEVTLEVKMGYKDSHADNWTELARSVEHRRLDCQFSHTMTPDNEGRLYECEMLPLLELGSIGHKYYLVNMRLPTSEQRNINMGIGKILDINLTGIHQNGGFTQVWFAMKTFLTPLVLVTLVWFWRRLSQLARPPVLLEKMILALGVSMTMINLPLEWLSVGLNWTWMLLFGDIRQGLFYVVLLSFWIIFCGEHLMDQTQRNRLGVYWKQVGAIAFGSLSLFIFDMCERGVQLTNPFYSIWATETGSHLATAFIVLAGVCACLYFLFLTFMVYQVFRNIGGKRSFLPAMSRVRRLHYEGLIFRFKFLMLTTLGCAALTVIFFIISQVNEGHWKWGDRTVHVNAAFFTGVYGMWNMYVFSVMFLYAPSHKRYGDADRSEGDIALAHGEELTTATTALAGGSNTAPTEVYRLAGKEAQE
ncbi:protein wntless homolog [Lampetra fluviatilis]